MAEGKANLPDDLALSKTPDVSWIAKEVAAAAAGANDDGKSAVGFHDEGKDQITSENSVPLSPQWLYVKPSESRGNFSMATGKDTRLPDGGQDKKEWRRPVPDIEGSRRWREEERETGLLGRRDRKKDVERENDYRKSDRRADSISARETADTKAMSMNERWHDVTGRNPVHENRRDSKWSTRWGPDDKEEPRTEKRVEADKEDAQSDKQSFISSRISSESDSRDKWRPRIRQEASLGATVYRAAPGFGLERGRGDGSNRGFASGRGRSNPTGKQPSVSSIGAVPSNKNEYIVGASPLSPTRFRYPRGKLLDIYRSHPPVDVVPVGMDAPGVVTPTLMDPLAFVTPGEEEEAVLDDIWVGNITSSEVLHVPEYSKKGGDNKDERARNGGLEDKQNKVSLLDELGLSSNDYIQFGDGINGSGKVSYKEVSPLPKLDFEGFEQVKLPDDSSSLFNASLSHVVEPTIDASVKEDNDVELLEPHTSLEELSLFYRDPQGEIQGPFLGVDIISWLEQGFFGTELPVCLSDAPEGTPFQELGEIMPHLKLKARKMSVLTNEDTHKSSKVATECLDLSALGSASGNDKKWLSPMVECEGNPLEPSTMSKPGDPSHNEYASLLSYNREISSDNLNHKELLGEHHVELPEEVLPKVPVQDMSSGFQDDFVHLKLPEMSSGIPDDHLLSRNSSSDPRILAGEMMDANLPDPVVHADNSANPLKALYSELEAISQKRPLSSNIPGIASSESLPYSTLGRDYSTSRLHHDAVGGFTEPSPILEALANNHRRNTDSNFINQDVDNYHLAHLEQNSGQFNLEEHLLSQQLHKQHIQQQNMLGSHQPMHISGSFLEQTPAIRHQQQSINQHAIDEHLLKLQLQQQQQQQQQHQQLLKLQQQRQHQKQLQQLQQQQLHHHQLHLMQQQQQSLAQQLVLQQLLQQPVRDPTFGSATDALQSRNMLDQVLLRQRLMHEQHALHPSRHHDLALDQLIKAKSVQNFQDEHKIRQKLLLEQQLLGLQLERQAPFSGMRHLQCMDDDSCGTGLWSIDDPQFVGGAAGSLPSQSTTAGQLDFLRRQQRQASFEHQSQIGRDIAMHNRMQRGLYESGLQPFDVPASMPASGHGLHLDRANSLMRLRGVTQEQKPQISSLGQLGQFPSGLHSQQQQIASKFPVSHADALEMHWSELSRQSPDNFVETQFSCFPQNSEGLRHEIRMNHGNDNHNAWLKAAETEEHSRESLMELLRRKDNTYNPESFENNEHTYNPIYESREPSWHSTRSMSDHSVGLLPDKGVSDYLAEAPHFSNIGQEQSVLGLDGTMNGLVSGDRLSERSGHGSLTEDEHFFARVSEPGESVQDTCVSTGSSLHAGDYVGSKGNITNAYCLEDPENGVDLRSSLAEHVDFLVDAPVQNSSAQSSGSNVGFNSEMGTDNAYNNDIRIERTSMVPTASAIPPRGLLNLQGTPTHQGPSDLPSASVFKGKMLHVSSEAVRQGGNTQVSENSNSIKRDFRISRVPSIGESDTPEASSYVEMLKAPRKAPVSEAESASGLMESSEAGQGAKSNKKKGKKGRQIDPSLLGFKVHSNRIMMGEIQRLDN